MIVVERLTTSKQTSKQATPPIRFEQSNTPRDSRNDPPSLTSASAMVHQHPLPLVSLQPRHRSTSNQNWSLQAPLPHTSTFQLVNRGPMGPPAQVWAKSDEGANSNLYVRLKISGHCPSGWHSAVGCHPACLCPSRDVLTWFHSKVKSVRRVCLPSSGRGSFARRTVDFLFATIESAYKHHCLAPLFDDLL
jgi:hypothetical protein